MVVSHNSEAVIGRCLQAIVQNVPGAPCLVMDNGSTDGTEAAVSTFGGQVNFVSSSSNDGFGRACNQGAQLAKTPFVAFVNPDCVVEHLDLAELLLFDRGGSVGLLAPAIRDPGKASRHLVKRFPRPWLHAWHHILGPLVPSQLPTPAGLAMRRSRLDWVSGAFFIVSRKEFLDLGGFDPAIFLYYEDTELGRRYRDAGHTVKLLKATNGSHEPGSSSERTGREAQFMTWSILSWLEYLSATTHGSLALRHAKLIRFGYVVIGWALAVASKLLAREPVRRKAAQYEEVSRGLDRAANGLTGINSPPTDPFYRRAAKLLSTCRK